MVLNTLKIWYQFRRHFKFVAVSSLGPVNNKHLFPPSLSDSTFSVWYDKGIKLLKHLYVFICFGLPVTHLFHYFQVRDFASKCFPNFRSVPPQQPFKSLFSGFPRQRGMILNIYDFILALSSQSDTKIKNAWETKLGIQLSEEVWEHVISRIRSTTSCARLGLIQFRVLYRVHFSKSGLSEIFLKNFFTLTWMGFGLTTFPLCLLFLV